MQRKYSSVLALSAIALAALILVLPGTVTEAQGNATQRPIEDWLDAQGQGFGLARGNPWDYISWTGRDPGELNPVDKNATVDYAGIDAADVEAESGGAVVIDTQVSGKVTEKALKDGRTEVSVNLRVTNALTYVTDRATGAVLFGATPGEVAEGATPALAEATLRFVYIIDRAPGGTMEDIVEVVFFGGGDILWASFHAVASGELADGTPALASVSETGPIEAAIQNGFKGGLGDAFPVENVSLQEVGN